MVSLDSSKQLKMTIYFFTNLKLSSAHYLNYCQGLNIQPKLCIQEGIPGDYAQLMLKSLVMPNWKALKHTQGFWKVGTDMEGRSRALSYQPWCMLTEFENYTVTKLLNQGHMSYLALQEIQIQKISYSLLLHICLKEKMTLNFCKSIMKIHIYKQFLSIYPDYKQRTNLKHLRKNSPETWLVWGQSKH